MDQRHSFITHATGQLALVGIALVVNQDCFHGVIYLLHQLTTVFILEIRFLLLLENILVIIARLGRAAAGLVLKQPVVALVAGQLLVVI